MGGTCYTYNCGYCQAGIYSPRLTVLKMSSSSPTATKKWLKYILLTLSNIYTGIHHLSIASSSDWLWHEISKFGAYLVLLTHLFNFAAALKLYMKKLEIALSVVLIAHIQKRLALMKVKLTTVNYSRHFSFCVSMVY